MRLQDQEADRLRRIMLAEEEEASEEQEEEDSHEAEEALHSLATRLLATDQD